MFKTIACGRAAAPASVVAIALSLIAAPASADLVFNADMGGSTEGLGNFAGSLAYVPAAGSGQLTVSLTNTTDPLLGGFITGFVFNINSADPDAAASLVSGTHPFDGFMHQGAPPFGTFDAGAALGGDWTGGGNPNAGIAVGDTGTFVFGIFASDAGGLTPGSFFDSNGGILVRFRGMANGGSDKVPSITPIPAPPAAAMLALAACAGAGRRRRA